jgi:hypothetical protein
VRSVGYVVLIHARVALPTPDYPFLDSFLTEFSEVRWQDGAWPWSSTYSAKYSPVGALQSIAGCCLAVAVALH